jgi:hypothetical protein
LCVIGYVVVYFGSKRLQGNDVRVLTRPVTIDAGTATPIVTAECLNGEHLVSGGYDVELAPGAYVSQNLPLGKQWLVQVNADKSSQASTGQAVALYASGHVSVYGLTR